MRIWKIISNSVGDISLVSKPGTKIMPGEHIKAVEAGAMIELMEICDRHLLVNGDDRVFADAIRLLRENAEISEDAG